MDRTNDLIIRRFGIRRRYRSDNLPWLSHRGNREKLAHLFAELGYTRGAEIGVRRAKYSKTLLDTIPNLHLYCVDPWDNYTSKYTQAKQDAIYKDAQDVLRPYGDRVTIIRKPSMDALGDIKELLDFVFIDGNHEFDYVCPDLIFWSRKVRTGGIVSLHDYYHFHLSGVVEAVDAYTKCHKIDPWYVTKQLEPTAFWVKP